MRQYALWDETPCVEEFYDRLCVEVAAKREEVRVEPAPIHATPRRSKMAVYE
ncbi:MAG TPA: hypothetical protein P5102_16260 [Candidatus Competibacteraceae bacterium]|nr:hypothetical protein [Candidatus Competibacteraceae bacterium]HRZ07664.1 hypothetical protein [Candidatus Competibacteraceae bacterium]